MYNFPLLVSLFTAAIILVTGAVLSLKKSFWTPAKLNALSLISMGILLTFSITELVPDVLEYNEHHLIFVALFILILIFANHHHQAIGKEHLNKTSVAFIITGVSIHYFTDGLLLSTAFTSEGHIELSLIAAILIHKFVETISFSFILRSLVKKQLHFIVCLLFLCLISTLGLFSGHFLIDTLNNYDLILGAAIAFSAALFIYLPIQKILSQNLIPGAATTLYPLIGVSIHIFIHVALEHFII